MKAYWAPLIEAAPRKSIMVTRIAVVAALVCASVSDSLAEGVAAPSVVPDKPDQGIALFAGRLHDGNIGDNFFPAWVEFEDNFIIGTAYDRTLWSHPDGWAFGAELGLAARLGADDPSAEIRGGAFARYDGLVLNGIRISPSLIWGLSYVTDTIGSEAERAARTSDTDGRTLFYLTPEIALSSVEAPEFEIFWRGQHRSGGYGIIGSMFGANAVTFGVRHRF